MLSQLLVRVPARVVRLTWPLLIVCACLAGLIAAGLWAQEHIRPLDRYHYSITSIECTPPPGQSRSDFLTEVQYLGELPSQVSLIDKDLPERLRIAFGKHPWVEWVENVQVSADRVDVRLMYRTPTLVVAPYNRVVDSHGILLPASAPTAGLPVMSLQVKPPAGAAGTPWGDEKVEAAARSMFAR